MRIFIKPIGNLGNQMLQYMLAVNLGQLAGGAEIFGYHLPDWNLSGGSPTHFARFPLQVHGHFIDVHQLARLARRGIVNDMVLAGLGFKLANLASVDVYRDIFRVDHLEVKGYGDDHLVINVRGAEILSDVHRDYRPMPFAYYDTLISETTAQPVFLGQIGDDFYSHKLRERYPNAVFQPSRGALIDFEVLRRSRNIALSVSTFSWLAGWFSEAQTIHYPLCGMLNPLQRPDIDLTPVSDPRYRFYDFPVETWHASPADIEALWAPGTCATIGTAELRQRIDQARAVTAAQRCWKEMKTSVRAYVSRAMAVV